MCIVCEHGILYVTYHFGSAKEIMNYGQQGFYDRIELNSIPTHMEMAIPNLYKVLVTLP